MNAVAMSRSDRRFDRILAFVCFAACETELALTWSDHSRPVIDGLLVAGLTAPLLARRRRPLMVSAVILTLTALAAADPNGVFSLETALFVVLIPPYSVGAHASRRSAVGLVVCLIGLELAVSIAGSGPYWALFVLGVGTASWSLGRTMRTRRELVESLAHTQVLIRGDQERAERMALVAERQQIVADLQSIVVDSLGAMIDQSRSARAMLSPSESATKRTGEAVQSITLIERTGQAALAEMRILLNLLQDVTPSETCGATTASAGGVGVGGRR